MSIYNYKHLVAEMSKGVYVEINNHSDNPVTNEVASRADRYYPKH